LKTQSPPEQADTVDHDTYGPIV